MSELWDVLDKNRNLTGKTIYRSEFPNKADEYHLVVHIWIKNKNKEWLISKRTANKTEPLKWAFTGGSVLAGETGLQGALREVKEELGIDLVTENGTLYKSFRRDMHQDFCDVWIFEHECDINDIVLQEDETCDAMWATKQTIRDMIADNRFIRLNNTQYAYDLIDDAFDLKRD